MKQDFPILDNHMHLDPKGLGLEGAKRFEKAGGTHLILVHKPYHHTQQWNWEKQFDTTLGMAKQVREKTCLKVYSALSPHPAELTSMAEKTSLEKAKSRMKEGIRLAAKHIENGRAIAFGEAGRPHYQISHELLAASNQLIEYTLEKAKELDCAVQFHTESGLDSFKAISKMAKKIGYPNHRCVKHFSGPSVDQEENFGLFPSITSRTKSLKKAISKGQRFFMETDYIDDLNRPDVVLPPNTVPKQTSRFLKNGWFEEGDIFEIHKENPGRVYGINIEI